MKDKEKPLFHWYVDISSGKELIFALYTRPCRYGRCAFCALPNLSLGGEAVSAQNIDKQVDYVLSQYTREQLDLVSKVSIYTASSSLDQECLPTRSLIYLILRICDFPNLKTVSLETRPEYVEEWELKALMNILGSEVKLEVAIGYETYDPELRNNVLGKGLSIGSLHRLMKILSDNKVSLKAYVMLKPHHTLSEEEGIIEANNGVKELHDLGEEYNVPVSIHLNPTYIAEGCRLTSELIDHGYEPPELSSIIEVLKKAREYKMLIYAGLDDEGLAVQGGTFRSTGLNIKKTVKAILAFNKHQDIKKLLKEANYS